MLKKTVTYIDYDGVEVTKDFYFNLTKAELAEMELTWEGGFAAHLRTISETNDAAHILDTFKKILCAAIGERDGDLFRKNNEIVDNFLQTAAYSEIFMELVSQPNKAAEFLISVIPAELSKKIDIQAAMGITTPTSPAELEDGPTVEVKAEVTKNVADYSRKELLEMPQETFDQIAGKDPQKMSRELLIVAMQRKSLGNQ